MTVTAALAADLLPTMAMAMATAMAMGGHG